MRITLAVIFTLILNACMKNEEISLPNKIILNCAPYGELVVTIDLMNDDPEFALTPNVTQKAYSAVIKNWDALWATALPMMEQEMIDYEYDKTISEIFNDKANTLNVMLMPPFEDEEYRLDLFIDIKKGMGSHVVGVEFNELEAEEVTFTF